MNKENKKTILIISSELEVSKVVDRITTCYPEKNWTFIYLLEDLKGQATEALRREDVFLIRDFARHDEVEEIFRQIAAAYSVTNVLANDEFAVYITALANHFWQLPGLNVEMATRFRDKKRMKDIARQAGIMTACEIGPEAISSGEVTFPVILKPRSLAGSVGVKIINDVSQLNEIKIENEGEYRDMDEKQYFIESYNPQSVYQIDAVKLQGCIVFLSVGEYIGKPIDFLNECPLGYFSVNGVELEKVWRPFSQKVLSAFDGPDGVYHIEAFGDAGSGVELLEIAWRPGGGATVEMIEIAFGLDLPFIHLVTQLGQGIELDIKPKGEAWGYMTFPKKHLAKEPLYVSHVSLPFVGKMPTLKMLMLPEPGDIASGEFFCHRDCLGSFVFCGDREAVAHDLKCVMAEYRVSTDPR
ncbi:serine kinase [Erwinia tracheiphila]|uniref:Serine kinase n=1 Tax=Erwinia tracheiphila TaxID=65700 RepID=A0A345CX35_9GAMM|nr:serine kinase [Erwinia tracheiphila]AXF78002.1 serine kinase [Erwinia tracheiphila]UIA83282.1 serine kinase [Erwinia tracheiphila]UIA91861.1 serine kinase [Erwinia tracheiphila]